MPSWRIAAALALAGSLCTPAAQAASCVRDYQVSLDIRAAHLTGDICTDGTLGTLGAGNIASWNLTLTNGFANGSQLDTLTWNSSNAASGPSVQLVTVGMSSPLSATASALQWDYGDPGSGNYAYLGFLSTPPGQQVQSYLYWYNYDVGLRIDRMAYGYNPTYTPGVSGDGNGSWITYGDPLQGDEVGRIPTVPEPGSLTLVGLALIGLTGAGGGLRRLALRRRQG